MKHDTTTMTEGDRIDQAWVRGGILWILALGALLLSFGGTVASMLSTWSNSASYNHCFLIPVISAYLVWERRALFSVIPPRPNWWGAAGVLAFALLWLLGRMAGAMVVEQFALVLMIQASVLAFFGWPATRALLLPVGFLLFAVPFGDFLVKPLQDFTAVFTVEAIKLVGIPVYMEGVFISTPSGDFHVAEVCSGVRFLIATVPLGVLFADIAFKSWWRRAAVIALSFVVPIVANGIRAFGIVYIAYLTDNEYATGVDHLVYGWIFFAIVIFLLFAIGMIFADKPRDEPVFKMPERISGRAPATLGGFGAVAVAVVLLANTAPLGHARIEEAMTHYTVPTLAAPAVGAGWRALPTSPPHRWKPNFRGVDAELVQDYERADGARVTLYYGYYGSQREGVELVQFGNTVVAPEPWEWSSRRAKAVDARVDRVISSRIITRFFARHVWHWYWSGGQVTTKPHLVKLHDLAAKLTGGEKAAAVVALSTPETTTAGQAEEVLKDFLDAMSADLPGIPGAR